MDINFFLYIAQTVSSNVVDNNHHGFVSKS